MQWRTVKYREPAICMVWNKSNSKIIYFIKIGVYLKQGYLQKKDLFSAGSPVFDFGLTK